MIREDIQMDMNAKELKDTELNEAAGGAGTARVFWYSVEENDTWEGIAARFGTTEEILHILNPTAQGRGALFPGRRILVQEKK